MRLMFVTGSLVHGGAERHTITVMNGLAARGHECHAVYVKNDPSQLGRIGLRGAGTVRCLGAKRYLDFAAIDDFAGQLSRLEPAIIIAANPYALMVATLARRQAGLTTPLLVVFHATKLVGVREHLKMLAERICFHLADALVFVCESQRRYWRYRGVWNRRTRVIYNGVDTDVFSLERCAADAVAMRDKLGLHAGDYVIGMSAVLRPEKNHVQLLAALVRLRRQGIPAKALLIGDGPMREAIESCARLLGIERHVTITGFQEDVRPYLAASDVIALCSFTEAFSLAAVEAMAMSRPVVHSDVGGAAEMISDGDNGYLFPAGDTEALVHALVRLHDQGRARLMGQHARMTAVTRFSETTMLDRYEDTLFEICRGSVRRSKRPAPQAITGAWPGVHNPISSKE